MQQFKCPQDLHNLHSSHPAYPRIKELIDLLIVNFHPPGRSYDPHDDGWICLIEEDDIDRVLNEIWSEYLRLCLGAGKRHYKQRVARTGVRLTMETGTSVPVFYFIQCPPWPSCSPELMILLSPKESSERFFINTPPTPS